MFQAKLWFEDLGSPLDVVGGGIYMGRSTIFPLQHRMLSTRVLVSDHLIAIITCERFPETPAGIQSKSSVSPAQLEEELNALASHLLDFAVLVIDKCQRSVRYRASAVLSVPAYLCVDDDAVSIDWDYERLLRGRTVRAVPSLALAYIAGISTYGPETMVAGVYRACANASLDATRSGVKSELPDAVEFDGPQEIRSEVDVVTTFLDTISAILSARPLNAASVAVELSGGMDSALTALVSANVLGAGLLSVGARFSGAMGKAQDARRKLLCERGQFDDLSVPAERFASFAPTGARRIPHAVLPDDENYPELFEPILAMLERGGVDTLISGLGGDELYTTYEGEDALEPTAPLSSNPFLTDRGVAIARSAESTYPAAWLQQSCWQSTAGRSQRLLRCGIWPINPYMNVALARFTSRLPRSYRRNRLLLRKTLTRLLENAVYETDYVKEVFGPVARRGIAENRDYLIDLVTRCPLSRMAEINDEAIVRTLEKDIVSLEKPIFESLFRTLKLFAFFQSGGM